MGYPLKDAPTPIRDQNNVLFGNKLKVLIINHCAHNKGDNSVLYFLSKKLSLQKLMKILFILQ